MIKVIYDNLYFSKEIQYVFDVIESIINVKCSFLNSISEIYDNDIVINYSKKIISNKNIINIIPSKLFSDFYLRKESLPQVGVKKYKDIPIIYCGNGDDEEAYINNVNGCIITNIDIIQSIFFMLTRYEEIILWDEVEKDMYGRFPAKECIAYKERFLDIPIVNEYIDLFCKWLELFNYEVKYNCIAGNKKFIACLTHDVDIPFKYNGNLINTIQKLKIKGQTIQKLKSVMQHSLSKINYYTDEYYTFDYIRKCEKKYNFKSSFYFMNGNNSVYENFYKINDERIIKLIRKLEEEGCEVGYHYSFNSYNDFNMRRKEKEELDQIFVNKLYGGRNHYLRFEPLESWRISEKCGLLYDTTLCYADYDGFRCGICFPYKPFDIKEKHILDIWEIPLIIMESTLIDKKYRNFDCNQAFSEIKQKINTVKKYGGVFTLLWHNSSFNNDWKGVFERTMKYLYDNNALGIDGRELIKIISGGEKADEKHINY